MTQLAHPLWDAANEVLNLGWVSLKHVGLESVWMPMKHHVVILKHKNVSSIEEYNIGDRLKYSRIKQSSKKDIEESRINVKYQEHYRSIWNSAKCKVQYRNFWNNAKY